MSLESLTQSARLVLSDLESLKHEHHLLLSSSSSIDPQKSEKLEKSLESIDLGIDEASVMLELESYFENFNNETQKLILQIQRLTQENNWLRDELSLTEKHLETSTQLQEDYQRDIRLLNESLSSNIQTIESQDLQNDLPIENSTNIKTYSEIPARFRTLHNLVIQYAQAGRYEVAVPLCRQALEDLEKTHGHTHPDVATMLNILALVYRDQNKFQEALQLLTEALNIREQTLGNDHPAVAATLNNLAVLYGKKNRYKEAEPLCKRALEIREKFFGKDHPDVGKQLNNLALLCLNQGKYEQVEEYYKRAIDIYTTAYGKTNFNVLKTKNNLASAYLREGKSSLALQLYQELLSESSLTSNRDILSIILKNLSAICRRQGFHDQADYLESSFNSPNIFNRTLIILKQLRTNDESMRQSQEYGKLRRSGSFQKLRQSIRRGSEKLVQKLRGTPTTNLPSFNSMQFHPTNSMIKRASSMSVLNHNSSSFPLQQKQTNRTLIQTCSIDQRTKQRFIPPSRGRLISAENIH